MADYKYRFMNMMKNHAPMKKSSLTRRALGQLRGMKMVDLTLLLKQLEDEGLIEVYVLSVEGVPGRKPDIYELTVEGKTWLTEAVKTNKELMKGIK